MDNVRRLDTMIVFGFILASVIVSRLFIYSFRHIPLTGQAGGEEALYALVGGVALAFSSSTLPLLVLYLTVLFTAETASSEPERGHGSMLPATLFLMAFVTAFVITISGIPSFVANPIYKGKQIINIAGGVLIVLYGLKAFGKSGIMKSVGFLSGPSKKVSPMVEALVVGFIGGLLLFHHLDPFYDSVFFLTGRAGPLSHHPLSVGSFGLGLGAMYVALAYGFGLLINSWQRARALAWIKGVISVLTVTLGVSFTTGTFSSLAAWITKGH